MIQNLWGSFLHKTRLRWLYERIESSLFWMRMGWRTHDWDSGYGLQVFAAYCKRLGNCIAKYGHHVDNEKDVKRIREFTYVLNRLIDNNYAQSLYDPNIPWRHETYPTKNPKLTGLKIISPPFKQTVLFKKGLDESWQYEKAQRQQDWDFISLYLKKYFDRWWD